MDLCGLSFLKGVLVAACTSKIDCSLVERDQVEKGLFFRHNISISPGDSTRFDGNVFFHRDAVSIYPVTLTSDNDAMKYWEIISIRGLIE